MVRIPHACISCPVPPPGDIVAPGLSVRSGTFLVLMLAMTVVLAFPSHAPGDTVSDQKQKLEKGINTYQINIHNLQQGIRVQQEEMEHNQVHESDLLAEMENIDARLQAQNTKLQVLQEKMSNQHTLIAAKEKELAKAHAEKHAVQSHLQKRLGAYYKTGTIGLFNVAFSAHTLPELLSFHDSFQAIIRYDRHLIETYRQSITGLERVKEALTLEKTLLQDFINQAEEEKTRINATKQEKERLLTLVRTQTQLHKQAIKEMETATNTLTSHLHALQKKEQIFDQGFLLNKGKLPPPVKGSVIALFNQEKTNKLGISTKYKGIAITAPDGTKVKSLFDGTILFSGYLRGYGNTVIVDHGYQYYSILARVEKLTKNKGDEVKTGDVLALMGETATLIDEGLYLEIRHENESLDPLQWLKKDTLSIATDAK